MTTRTTAPDRTWLPAAQPPSTGRNSQLAVGAPRTESAVEEPAVDGEPRRRWFTATGEGAAYGKRGRPAAPRAGDEAGSVTLWLVIMTVAMIAAIGLVFDGGEAQATKGQAIADAYGAARAGAEALDQAGFAAGGAPAPDTEAATGAVRSFLYAAGVGASQARVTVDGAVVTVVVHLRSSAPILASIGVGAFNVAGQGSARAIYGVRGPTP